jgi:hypothetical protein
MPPGRRRGRGAAGRQACEIRLRAERKAGRLLKEMQKAKSGGDQKSDHRSQRATSDQSTLAELGISKPASVAVAQPDAGLAWRKCCGNRTNCVVR